MEPSLPDRVRAGLARNPAIPAGLLLRLLAEHPATAVAGLARRSDLPPSVSEAMLTHPEPFVRKAAAVHHGIAARQRMRLLSDPSKGVARWLREDRDPAMPEDVLRAQIDWIDGWYPHGLTQGEMRGELWEMVYRDRRAMAVAARDHRAHIRVVAAEWIRGLDEADRQALLDDPEPEVRSAAADAMRPRVRADLPDSGIQRYSVLTRPLAPELVADLLANSADEGDLISLAANPTTPSEPFLEHPSPDVRRRAATRTDLTAPQLARLAADPDASVRTAVSVHPGLSESQRAAIEIEPAGGCSAIHSPDRGPGDPYSVNPLLRRRAAADPGLTAEQAAVLAADADPVVRIRLALHHPAAPPELLLRSYLEGCDATRKGLIADPRFPVDGVSRFGTDPDPALRRLALLDPTADPALIEHLSHDEDLTVRCAAAATPTLPVRRVITLLDDPELAEHAGTNPALPIEEMAARI